MEKTQSYTRYLGGTTSDSTTNENSSREIGAPSDLSHDKRGSSEPPKDLSFLHDVPVTITAEVGRCTMTIRRLLGLIPGSILTLTEEPQVQVTVRANGNDVARGEVVTVNDHFGIRITEINDQKE